MKSISLFIIASMIGTQPPGEIPDRPESIALWKVVQELVKAYENNAADTPLQKLQKERANTAISEWKLRNEEWKVGRGTLDIYLDAGQRLLDVKIALAKPNEVNSLLEQYVALNRWNEALQKARYEVGAVRQEDLEVTHYFRLDAEIQLLRNGGKLPALGQAQEPGLVEQYPPKDLIDDLAIPEIAKLKPFIVRPTEPELQRWLKYRANCALSENRIRIENNVAGRGLSVRVFDSANRARHALFEVIQVEDMQIRLATIFRDWQADFHFRLRSAGHFPDYGEPFCMRIYYEVVSAESQFLSFTEKNGQGRHLPKLTVPDLDLRSDPPRELEDAKEETNLTKEKPVPVEKKDSESTRLLKYRAHFAMREVRVRYATFRNGRGSMDDLLKSGRRARDVRLQLADTGEKKSNILTQYLDFTRAIEKLNQSRFEAGALKQQDLEQSRYDRLTAEIELLKAKEKS